jgi:CO/xanthine dehydrogenase Mo-binding subunit
MITRRELLSGGGALIVSFAAGIAARVFAQGRGTATASPIDPRQLDSWLAITADGSVTACTGKCELGQGMFTAQIQLVAEELSVEVSRVRLIQCDTSTTPDQGTTSGSQSSPTNFNNRNLGLAAATAREALLERASARFGVPVTRLTVSDGMVVDTVDPANRVSYGALVGGQRWSIALSGTAKRKPAREWTVLGTSVPRVDMAALATGAFEFVHNVRVEGMVHGRVVRPPEVGARLVDVDEKSVADLPGFIKCVRRNDFLGIVCEKPWQAVQAARALKATWTPGVGLPASSSFYTHLRQQPSRNALVVDSGDVDETLRKAGTVVTATYLHPYQMHGSMGTSCAVADVSKGRATIWSPTQSVYPVRSTASIILGIAPEHVRVIYVRGSGCYGINGADTVSYDAAVMSQAVGRPVRVQLSRQDEMAWENYGFAYLIEQRVALDRRGSIVAWDCESWNAALGGRPGYETPGNVISGSLLGFAPAPFTPRAAPPPPTAFNNGSNAAPSYVAGCVGAACGGTGTVKSERVLTHTIRSPFFTGPLRSPSRLQNTFAHESFMDELAARVGADPVEFRLRHLRDKRLIEVVKAAASAARWETRPSPRSARPAEGRATGRGIACVLYEGDNGYCALVAEVDVDQSTGRIVVSRLVASQDCGPISSPDGMRNQIEGGALQGLSRALGEAVTWDGRKVTSIDWQTYRSLTLGADVPAVESVLINRPDEETMGAGETTITLTAAAVGNAVFDATGARLREVPFTPERVRAALAARAPA